MHTCTTPEMSFLDVRNRTVPMSRVCDKIFYWPTFRPGMPDVAHLRQIGTFPDRWNIWWHIVQSNQPYLCSHNPPSTGWTVSVLRCVLTMLLLRAAKSIPSTLKKNFCQLYFSLQKLQNEKHVRIICFAKNYVSLQLTANISIANFWWTRHFASRIFMPCGILQHARACRNHAKAARYWRVYYF